MFWKFLDPGFLKRWSGEPEKSVQQKQNIDTMSTIMLGDTSYTQVVY